MEAKFNDIRDLLGIDPDRFQVGDNLPKNSIVDSFDDWHNPSPIPLTRVRTDGTTKTVRQHTLQASCGHYLGGGYDERELVDATYSISYEVDEFGSKEVHLVEVNTSCDPESLEKALIELFYGKGANRLYLEALKDSLIAEEWLSKNLCINRFLSKEAGPDTIILEGDKKLSLSRWTRGEQAIVHLIKVHGHRVLTRVLSNHGLYEQKNFIQALESLDEAEKFIATKYKVALGYNYGRGYGESEGYFLSFTHKEGSKSLSVGEFEASTYGGRLFDPLRALLKAHRNGGLLERLEKPFESLLSP